MSIRYNYIHDLSGTDTLLSISGEDWERVQELALDLVNTSDVDDERIYRRRLLDFLGDLRARYGELPSILATEADYVEDVHASESLLLRAFDLAKQAGDVKPSRVRGRYLPNDSASVSPRKRVMVHGSEPFEPLNY